MATDTLRFVDSLLRCGVATLFGLDAWRRAARLLDERYGELESYAEMWSTKGISAGVAAAIPWLLVALSIAGASLLIWPRRAAIGALLLVAAAGLELASLWGHPWEPRAKLGLILGAALVAVSQALLRSNAGVRQRTPAGLRF